MKICRNIIEVGSWNEQGSTLCVMNAIIYKKNSTSYSFEADQQKYAEAKMFWENKNTKNKLF